MSVINRVNIRHCHHYYIKILGTDICVCWLVAEQRPKSPSRAFASFSNSIEARSFFIVFVQLIFSSAPMSSAASSLSIADISMMSSKSELLDVGFQHFFTEPP